MVSAAALVPRPGKAWLERCGAGCALHLPRMADECPALPLSPHPLGSPQHPTHNLPQILFVHSHVWGAAIPPLLKGYTPPLPALRARSGGLFSLLWAAPLPLLSPHK